MIAGLRGRIWRIADALRPPWWWQSAGQRQQLSASLRFWADGGIALRHDLPASSTREAAELRIVLQPDGDVLLMLPTGFGNDPADEAAAAALFSRAGSELAVVTRGPLPTAIGALFAVLDIALLASGVGSIVHAATGLIVRKDAEPVVWLALPLLVAAGRWLLHRFVRPWLVDKFLGAARAKIAAATG